MPCPSCLRAGPDTLCGPCGPHGPFLIGISIWSKQMESRLSNLRVRLNLTLYPPKPVQKFLTLDDLDL